MLIKTEDLLPKKIINFYLPQELKLLDKSVVLSKPAASKKGMVHNLMQVDGITKILLTGKLLSVYYDTDNKDDLRMLVLAELDDYLTADLSPIDDITNVSDIEWVETLSDAFIRPTLNRDKGDIEIISFIDGILKIKFMGHCAGCPYAQNTLQNVIAKTLLNYMPRIKEISLEDNK